MNFKRAPYLAAAALATCLAFAPSKCFAGSGLLVVGSDQTAQARPTLRRRSHSARSVFPAGLAFAGDKFVAYVGDLYWFGPTDVQLSSFPLSVKIPFGDVETGFEHPIAASLGLAGFPCRDIYIGAGNQILHLANGGAKVDLFAHDLDASVRMMLFDVTGAFGYQLVVATRTGSVYLISDLGKIKRLASFGEDLGGMDIVPPGSEFGPLDGQMIVASRVSGRLQAVNSLGLTSNIETDRHLFSVEGLFMVPRNLGSSRIPEEEGYYSIIFPNRIYKSSVDNLRELKGDVLITTLSGVARHWLLHWSGVHFELKEFETFEDGVQAELLVTPTMIDLGRACSSTPVDGKGVVRTASLPLSN